MKNKVLLVIISIFLLCCPICFAHSGRTDSNGGHYDRSTGEYHYHHGYPAHQHIDGVCPYDNNNNKNSKSSNSVKSSNTTSKNTTSSYTKKSSSNATKNTINTSSNWSFLNFLADNMWILYILLAIAVYVLIVNTYELIKEKRKTK